MKRVLFMAVVLSLPGWAQSVDVKNVDAGENTTIEIRKGGTKVETKSTEALWEVQDGTADIEGDSAAMAKDAKANWKKACDEWKKEFRADNKENKIISLSCGTVTCSGETGNKVCNSKATYKIKTKMN